MPRHYSVVSSERFRQACKQLTSQQLRLWLYLEFKAGANTSQIGHDGAAFDDCRFVRSTISEITRRLGFFGNQTTRRMLKRLLDLDYVLDIPKSARDFILLPRQDELKQYLQNFDCVLDLPHWKLFLILLDTKRKVNGSFMVTACKRYLLKSRCGSPTAHGKSIWIDEGLSELKRLGFITQVGMSPVYRINPDAVTTYAAQQLAQQDETFCSSRGLPKPRVCRGKSPVEVVASEAPVDITAARTAFSVERAEIEAGSGENEAAQETLQVKHGAKAVASDVSGNVGQSLKVFTPDDCEELADQQAARVIRELDKIRASTDPQPRLVYTLRERKPEFLKLYRAAGFDHSFPITWADIQRDAKYVLGGETFGRKVSIGVVLIQGGDYWTRFLAAFGERVQCLKDELHRVSRQMIRDLDREIPGLDAMERLQHFESMSDADYESLLSDTSILLTRDEPEITPLLLGLLRKCVATQLNYKGEPVSPGLLERLTDSSPLVRRDALSRFWGSSINADEAAPHALRMYLEDPDLVVRETAQIALECLLDSRHLADSSLKESIKQTLAATAC